MDLMKDCEREGLVSPGLGEVKMEGPKFSEDRNSFNSEFCFLGKQSKAQKLGKGENNANR